jgi:hypothetical protein
MRRNFLKEVAQTLVCVFGAHAVSDREVACAFDSSWIGFEQCVHEPGLAAKTGEQREVNISRNPWFASSLNPNPADKGASPALPVAKGL